MRPNVGACYDSPRMTNGAVYCNRCGTQNSALAKFCANCGTPFSADIQQQVASAAPPEITTPPQSPPWQPQATWPPPIGYGASVSGVQYAGFWIRFVAFVIDAILVAIVVLPFSLIISVMIRISGSAVAMPGIGIDLVTVIVRLALSSFANWIYEAALESSSKQATVGKMVLGLKVTDLEGRRISFLRATGRHFAKILSAMIFLIGYIMAGFTLRKQALHDIIAGTFVVRTQ
jgi:uncharacterized RDD family membrane protein YckC